MAVLWPHGVCLHWHPGIMTLHILGDLFVALAYFCIPITLIYFYKKRRDLPFSTIVLWFSCFIIWCGMTHLVGIIELWYPYYLIGGLIKVVTALVSMWTLRLLIPFLPQILEMPRAIDLIIILHRMEQRERQLKQEISALGKYGGV